MISSFGTWFNEIIQNLKEWFGNIGTWFSELGASISKWFSDLLQGFKDWWQGVLDWLHDLITIPDGFGEEYKAKWQAFMEKHFGLLYQSVHLITDTLGRISDGIVENKHYITFPEIKLPYFDKVILEANVFCFEDFVNSYSWARVLYNLFITAEWGAFVFMFINLALKKYNNIIGVED